MRCPRCANNHAKKDGPVCKKCGRTFVFFDKDPMSDGKFATLLSRASSGNTLYFTRDQLYTVYALQDGSSRPGIVSLLVILAIGVGSAFAFFAGSAGLGSFLAVAAVISLAIWLSMRSAKPPPRASLMHALDRWHAAEPIEKLIDRPSLQKPPQTWREPDIYDYGVERILVVQHDILVDLFVKNGLHAQERAVIVSERGYPDYIVPIARRLLEESPQLPIFLLHDADATGLMMQRRLEGSGLLPLSGHPIIDTGLTPRDVGRLAKLRPLRPETRGNALPADALPYGLLATGFTLAFADALPLGALIDRQKIPDADATTSHFG